MRIAALLIVALLCVLLYTSRQAASSDPPAVVIGDAVDTDGGFVEQVVLDVPIDSIPAPPPPVAVAQRLTTNPAATEVKEIVGRRQKYLELAEQLMTTWSREQLEENIKKVEVALVDGQAAELLRSAEDTLGQVQEKYPKTSSGRIARAMLDMLEQSRRGRQPYPTTAAPDRPGNPYVRTDNGSLVPVLPSQ